MTRVTGEEYYRQKVCRDSGTVGDVRHLFAVTMGFHPGRTGTVWYVKGVEELSDCDLSWRLNRPR